MNAPLKKDNVAAAAAAWGDPTPDWVIVLAEACNAQSQAAIAKRIGYSSSTVSQVLSNKYGMGDIAKFEQVVRGALMAETVACPIVGDMTRDVCLNWQARPFSTTNSNAVRMYQACRSGCPHSRLAPGDQS